MALNITTLPRVFKHGALELADPDKNLSPDEVMSFYSNTYSELTTSNVHGPKMEGNKVIYEFRTIVGTKG